MGVQLSTDAGPKTVTWTNAFYPYGVEVFADPISRHLVLGEGGPVRVGPDHESRWAPFLRTPVVNTMSWWDQIKLGAAMTAGGKVVAPARSVLVPTAMRLDINAGSVWSAAAMPEPPTMTGAFIPGDEIMVVFSGRKMAELGFKDRHFVR